MLLLPTELGRMAAVAVGLCAAVAEACAFQLRASRFLLLAPGGSSRLAHSERLLHRTQRQSAALRPTCVAAENYSTGIDARGRLIMWGRPGWLEVARTSHFEDYDSRVAQWPALRPQFAFPVGKSEGGIFQSGSEDASPSHGRRPTRIAAVAASRHAVFALTAEGSLMYAQVRRRSDFVIHNVELHALQELVGVRVAQISTRFGQAFAVTAEGSVYAWGMKSGDSSRPEHTCSMGLGSITTLIHPTPIPSFGPGAGSTPIRFVATGISHTLFVSVFGEVYAVGRTENGKLGLGPGTLCTEQITVPTKVHFDSRPVPGVVSAAAGARHSLLLSSTGEVWGCGLAKSGALPLARQSQNPRPVALPTPRLLDGLHCFCTAVAAGISISFFVGECGEVHYSGTARQTTRPFGRPASADPWEPRRIPGLRQVEQVSISMELSYYQWEHAIFVRQDGSLYAWGHLGHGEFHPREDPTAGMAGGALRGATSFSSIGGLSTLGSYKDMDPPGFCNTAVPIEILPCISAPP